jgi:large subunit ribosomal protein L21
MYAIVKAGGKQYRVKEGDRLRIEKMSGDVGSKVTLDTVLMVKKDNDVLIGTPKVAHAKIEGTIVRHGRGQKILVYTYKRRKGYEKRRGHRQDFTEITVDKIKVRQTHKETAQES